MAARTITLAVVATTGPAPAAGNWQELPNTSLRSAWVAWGLKPEGAPTGATFAWGSPHNGILESWSSGAYDTLRHRLVLPRYGGHGSWSGNQVLAFNCDTNTWELPEPYTTTPFPPDIDVSMQVDGKRFGPVYPDGTPSTVHSYESITYMPPLDRVSSMGGVWWSAAGKSAWEAAEYDVTLPDPPANKWRVKTPGQTWRDGTPVNGNQCSTHYWWGPGNEIGGSVTVDGAHDAIINGQGKVTSWYRKLTQVPVGYGKKTCWDPTLNIIWVRGSGGLFMYNPWTDSYTSAGRTPLLPESSTDGSWKQSLVLDNKNRILYRVIVKDKATLQICKMDLNVAAGQPGDEEVLVGSVTGFFQDGAENVGHDGIGVLYDEEIGRIVVYVPKTANDQGGGAAFSINPIPGFTLEPIANVSSPVPPYPTSQGIWKRFFKHRGYYYVVNGFDNNVWRISTPDLAKRTMITGAGAYVVS